MGLKHTGMIFYQNKEIPEEVMSKFLKVEDWAHVREKRMSCGCFFHENFGENYSKSYYLVCEL